MEIVAEEFSLCLKRPLNSLDLKNFPGTERLALSSLPVLDIVRMNAENLQNLRKYLKELSGKSLIFLIETAQPTDADFLFATFAYTEEISGQGLYFCSNTYWYAGGNLVKFESWTHAGEIIPHYKNSEPSILPRYYSAQSYFLKKYQSNISPKYHIEFNKEINHLNNYAKIFPVFPKVIASSEKDRERWLLRERVPGLTFLEAFAQKKPYNPRSVIDDILKQMVRLEEDGLFHTDIRAWNMLLTEEGKGTLIDYGALNTSALDAHHHHTVYFSFIKFCYEVIHGFVAPFSPAYLNPDAYPQEFCFFIQNILTMPASVWNFSLFSQILYRQNPPAIAFSPYLNKMTRWLHKQQARFEFYIAFGGRERQLLIIGKPFTANWYKTRIRHYEKKFFKRFVKTFIRRQLRGLRLRTKIW